MLYASSLKVFGPHDLTTSTNPHYINNNELMCAVQCCATLEIVIVSRNGQQSANVVTSLYMHSACQTFMHEKNPKH